MLFFKKKMTVNETINIVRTTPGAMLIDCRCKEDYTKGHVAGAVNFPVKKISAERVTNRIPDKEKLIYVVGSYSDRPSEAVSALKKLGYKNVKEGGYMDEHYGLLSR